MNIEDLYRLMRTGHVRAQGIVDTVADPMLVLDANLCVQSASRAFFSTFQVDRDDTIGVPLYELGNGQWDIPELRRLLVEVIPKATAVVDYQVTHDFPNLGRRSMLVTARTLHHPDNGSHSMLLTIVDATDRLRDEAEKGMLFGELRHRMKNLLAAAQSVAHHTQTAGRTAEEYRDDFLGRLSALIEAQEVAFSGQTETDLAALVHRLLAPYMGGRDTVAIQSGGSVKLAPGTIQALSLVLHELATNAAKYGALSVPGGHVSVGWRMNEDGRQLHLSWIESGGPPVSEPTTTGYGTQLIHSAMTYSLGGRVDQKYAPSGVETEIVIPLAADSAAA